MSTLIIWDWDNTLMNTRPAVTEGLQDVCRFYQLPDITPADVLNVMTNHRGDFWQRNFGENVPQAVARYVEYYRSHMDMVKPFDQTESVLNFIRSLNLPQIILSNKNHESLVEEVKRHQLDEYFEVIQGTNGPLGKPDVAFVAPHLNLFKPERIILIGDGVSDMLMAQNLNAEAILVHQPDNTLPHHHYCENLSDVLSVLKTLLS
ncbi:MAG: HAD family hydrolase [Alphaproteobacteria bacterium]|nr:HAD family hydrolase [Alphaproteobacteria bacterium]MBR3913838.1 HAD family hydrolase [Alphaproteobacteria bacterium]